MSMTIFDVNANTLEAAWYLDTPAGPLPQAGGNVSLDRSWTPVLQATTEYNTDHELADQIEPLSPDPLVLRLRTQTAGLPILDGGRAANKLKNSSFELDTDGWTVVYGTLDRDVDAWSGRMAGQQGRAIARATSDGSHRSLYLRTLTGAANMYPVTVGNWIGVRAWAASDSGMTFRVNTVFLTATGTTLVQTPTVSLPGRYYEGRTDQFVYQVPPDAAGVRVEVIAASEDGNPLPIGKRLWSDGWMLVEATTEEEAARSIAEYHDGTLSQYEWPAPDIVGARVNQATYWVYPRSTREDVVNRRTSVELASADLLMAEVRNGSGEPWIAPPSTDDSYGRTDYVMTRSLSQAIVHAGLPITVLADDAETSPLDEPTWAVADNLTSFMQALLHSRYAWQFNPRLNQYQLRYQPPQPASYSLGSAGRRLQSAVITRGDSTELGTLDYADGLILYWRWTSRYDGSTHERVETVLADHITDWRQVTKWAELTINSAPQTYGQNLLGNRTDRGAQALITAALDAWSVDDLGLKWSDAASSYQTLSFSVDGGTYTINGPLREG